jgi:hypothetical protein
MLNDCWILNNLDRLKTYNNKNYCSVNIFLYNAKNLATFALHDEMKMELHRTWKKEYYFDHVSDARIRSHE